MKRSASGRYPAGPTSLSSPPNHCIIDVKAYKFLGRTYLNKKGDFMNASQNLCTSKGNVETRRLNRPLPHPIYIISCRPTRRAFWTEPTPFGRLSRDDPFGCSRGDTRRREYKRRSLYTVPFRYSTDIEKENQSDFNTNYARDIWKSNRKRERGFSDATS